MNPATKPVPGGPPNVTPRVTPLQTPVKTPLTGEVGRSMTQAELRAGRRQSERAWSPSTRPVPVQDIKLKPDYIDRTWSK